MLEGVLGIIPVEMKPMSIITLLILFGMMIILRDIYRRHNELRAEYEKKRDAIDKEIKATMGTTMNAISNMKVDVAELKEGIKNITTSLVDLKQDIRDIRKIRKR